MMTVLLLVAGLIGTPSPSSAERDAGVVTRWEAVGAFARLPVTVLRAEPRREGWDAALLSATAPEAGRAAVPPKDVDTYPWSYATYAPAFESGLFHGDSAAYFRGKRPFTRRQLAVVAARCLLRAPDAPPQGADPPWFRDVRAEERAAGPILVACRSGVMQGYGDGLFRPERPVTRGELETVTGRLLKLLQP